MCIRDRRNSVKKLFQTRILITATYARTDAPYLALKTAVLDCQSNGIVLNPETCNPERFYAANLSAMIQYHEVFIFYVIHSTQSKIICLQSLVSFAAYSKSAVFWLLKGI